MDTAVRVLLGIVLARACPKYDDNFGQVGGVQSLYPRLLEPAETLHQYGAANLVEEESVIALDG